MKKHKVRRGYIYLLTCLVTLDEYVGQAVDSFIERWKEHHREAKNGNDRPLYRAMRKYPG